MRGALQILSLGPDTELLRLVRSQQFIFMTYGFGQNFWIKHTEEFIFLKNAVCNGSVRS
jgi:hypothetical protein